MDTKTFFESTTNAIADYLFQELSIRPSKHYQVRNATDGPRILTITLLLNPKYAKQVIAMREALSMAARLERDASIRVGRGDWGALLLEVPKPRDLWYNVHVANLPRRRGLAVNIGLDDDNRPTGADFTDPLTPHALFAGTTGSGKTNAARLMVHNLAKQNEPDAVEFVLIDTKKRGAAWRGFETLYHLAHPIIREENVALRALSWGSAEIDRRATMGRSNPQLFIAIDESQDVLDKPEFVKVIGDVARTGREFGVHLLLVTQDPTAKQLGDPTIKRNLTGRLVGRVNSPADAHIATGQKESGAELLMGAGDLLLVRPDGMTRMTAALVTADDIASLPRSTPPRTLDFDQYEDVDRVVEQADNARKATGFDALETTLALIAARYGYGRPWLKDVLEAEGQGRPGSGRAGRLLDWGREINGLLRRYRHKLALTD